MHVERQDLVLLKCVEQEPSQPPTSQVVHKTKMQTTPTITTEADASTTRTSKSTTTTKKGYISMESALKFLSGGVAGTFSTVITQPMDVIKTNMILKAGAFKSSSPMIEQRPTMMSTARMIYKEQGIRGLYRGSIPTFLRVAPGALLYYNMLSYLKEMTLSAKQITSMIHTSVDRDQVLNSTRLSAFESFCIAAFSRGLTGVILCPITVVKTRLVSFEAMNT